MRKSIVNYIRIATLQAVAVCAGVALWAERAHAQEMDSSGAFTAAGLVSFAVMMMFFLVFYLYTALCLQVIATKTGTANAWLAWIPIANVFLMLNVAQKPAWWFILMLIPFVNIIIAIIVWMQIAKARRKAEWWGIMMIVPVMNFIAPGYLAFSE